MSQIINCTLVADGSSDRMLIAPLTWCMEHLYPEHVINIQFPDLRPYFGADKTLAAKISMAVRLFPADVLFIHRDAETESFEHRILEINSALAEANLIDILHIPVIPIRMSEAWFLHDETAIRFAVGNPNGTAELTLPTTSKVHLLTDPKHTLEQLLRIATGNNRRRQRNFRPRAAMHRVADLIDNFSALKDDPAFQRLLSYIEAIRPNISLTPKN